jgi:hypothetical protein
MSFYSKNLFLVVVDTYLTKHHQNSGAKLFQPEVLEQSNSELE